MIDASAWYQATALALLRGKSLSGFKRRRRRFARSYAAGASLRQPGYGNGNGYGASVAVGVPVYSGPIDTDTGGEGAPVNGGRGGGGSLWAPDGDKVVIAEIGPQGSIDPFAPASLASPVPPSVASAAIASMALDGYRRSRRGR